MSQTMHKSQPKSSGLNPINQSTDDRKPPKESPNSSRNHSTLSILRGYETFHRRRRYRLFTSAINELEHTQSGRMTDSCRFVSMSVLTSTMMTAELVVGVITGSLTLLSDALHMASDLIALIIGYMAHRKANSADTDSSTFQHAMGWFDGLSLCVSLSLQFTEYDHFESMNSLLPHLMTTPFTPSLSMQCI